MVRNFLAVVSGMVVAIIVITTVEFANTKLFPLPLGINPFVAEEAKLLAMNMPVAALMIVALGYFLGTFAATVISLLVQPVNKIPAYVVCFLLLAATMLNLFMIQHPTWFIPLALGAIPLGLFLGMGLQRRLTARNEKY
jgi:hypothetical protein